MKALQAALVLGVVVGPQAHAQAPVYVRETALARLARARAMAADAELVKAVVAKNATRESTDDIARKDKEWTENPRAALRRMLSTSACAQRLRELIKDDPVIVEAILMDAQGANVCVSHETSDYWQGDEAKFKNGFGADREIFVDEPALDASTGSHAIQLSVIVHEGKTKVGALTLTLRVPKEDALGK